MDNFQTIYLGSNDDIASVIDYVSESKMRNLVLVIPKEAELFGGVINLQLLKREAENLNKKIFIATADVAGRYLAKQAGIELADKFVREDSYRGEFEKSGAFAAAKEDRGNESYSRSGSRAASEMSGRRSMADIVVPSRQSGSVKKTGPVFHETMEAVEPRRISQELYGVRPQRIAKQSYPDGGAESAGRGLVELRSGSAGSGGIESVSREIFEPIGTENEARGESHSLREEYLPEEEDLFESQPTKQPSKQAGIEEFGEEYFTPRAPEENQAEEDLLKPSSSRAEEILKNLQPLERGAIKKERKRTHLVGWKKKFFVGFIATIFIVIAGGAYYIFPRAEVAITPKKESLSFDLSIVADKNITKTDSLLNRIPAQVIKVEVAKNGDFPSTGERYLQEKARGVITVYNAYSSSSQGLVQNTRFVSTETGKLFRTTKSVVIPGAKIEGGKIIASSIDIEVAADQPGPDYNIGPSNFTIPGFQGGPKYSGFYGKSNSSMRGGATGKVKVVLQEDLDRAQSEVAGALKQELDQNLKNQIPNNFKLLDGSVKGSGPEISFSHQAGEAADGFSINAKSQNTAIVFAEQYTNELADQKIVSSAGQNAVVVSSSRKIIYNSSQADFNKGVINMNVGVSQDITRKIDAENLKQNLVGKNETEIRRVLSKMQEIQDAKVSFWPFWVRSMPLRADKIKILLTD